MVKPKLIIKKEKKKLVTFKPIQIWTETHEIITDLCEETGLNKAALIHRMITFAAEHMEIVEEEA